MKKFFLFVALIASTVLVGCGGGGGGGSTTIPVNNPKEAIVARYVVAPIVGNAAEILNYTPAPAASYRFSKNNSEGFSFNNISNNVQTALKSSAVLKSALRAVGVPLSGQFDKFTKHEEIATFDSEKGIFERKVFKDVATSKSNPNDYLIYYRIENCKGNINADGILTLLTINENAPVFVDDIEGGVKFTGTINTDLAIHGFYHTYQQEGKSVVYLNGDKINGYEYNKEIQVTNQYTLSKISLNLTSLEIKDNFDYEHNVYSGITTGTVANLSISGLDGTSVEETKKIYCDGRYVINSNGELLDSPINAYTSKLVVTDERNADFNLTAPVIAVSGEFTNTEIATNKVNKGKINSLVLKVTKLTEDESTYGYRVDKAEAHIDIDSVSTSDKIIVGDKELAFSWAKIDLTNIKYDDSWKNLAESERTNNIFGNAIASLTFEEIKNNVLFYAKYNVANHTITGKLTNNGSYIVKDNDNLLQFNFDTVDITGKNVRIVEQNNCEGASFIINGTEKDGTKSNRTYLVQNEKLVLIDSNDKQLVSIPEGLDDKNASEINEAITSVESDLVRSDKVSNLQLAVSDGVTLAKYVEENSADTKIETNAIAKENVIYGVSYYGNSLYTIVFALDNFNNKIKGVILEGKNTSATLNTKENLVGTFSGIDNSGYITIVASDLKEYREKVK